MKSWGRIALLVALAAATAPAAKVSDLWLHIRVAESGSNPTTVKVNLPFSLVQRAAPLIEDARIAKRDGHIVIDVETDDEDVRVEVPVASVRATWRGVIAPIS